MTLPNLTYDQIVDRFVGWAGGELAVRAGAIIGSRARSDHPADAWSDLDLLIFVRDIDAFIAQGEWASAMGPLWLNFVERTADGSSWERRVLYAGGLDVDYALFPAQLLAMLQTQELPLDMVDVLRRGYRILLDKDGHLQGIVDRPLPQRSQAQPPAEAEFLNVVHDFWYHAVWTAKHLRRGELWWAKSGCDMRLKELLRRMLEWHARATRSPGVDTWLRGRFLEEWADPEALVQLGGVFATYDAADVARALVATMDLFRRLAVETAQAWDYTYPAAGAQAATDLVAQIVAVYMAGSDEAA